jgi:hypothetical protein
MLLKGAFSLVNGVMGDFSWLNRYAHLVTTCFDLILLVGTWEHNKSRSVDRWVTSINLSGIM